MEEIRALEEEWAQAVVRRDAETLGRLIHDDFTFTSSVSTGGLLTKAQYIEFVTNVLAVASSRFPDFRAKQYGDAAVVHARYEQHAIVLGQEMIADYLLTDVWVREDGVWRVVARHSSKPLD